MPSQLLHLGLRIRHRDALLLDPAERDVAGCGDARVALSLVLGEMRKASPTARERHAVFGVVDAEVRVARS